MQLAQMLQMLQSVNPTLAAAITQKLQGYLRRIEAALPLEQQYFVMAQAPRIEEFLDTPQGRAAVQQFVAAWVQQANSNIQKPSPITTTQPPTGN